MTKNKHWWQKTTIYQIYPRSFKDSNNDGIGDIQGIISKLNYIKELGFETIWISPFFTSPQQDWGYDVSDYCNIDPDYGDLNDVEELIEQVHHKEMRILFDLVLNHSSDQHPWFLESHSSVENPKRDWYIWRDGRGSRPPNNWRSIVGGSAWHYDHGTNQWYYASFLPCQPDLNYRNPEVIRAMFNIAKYWLDKGIDGFRLDIFHTIFKDQQFRDNPMSFQLFPHDFRAGFFQKWMYNLNQPETIQLAIDLRELVDSYSPERMLIGEIFADEATIRKYLGQENAGFSDPGATPWLPINKNYKQVNVKVEQNNGGSLLNVYRNLLRIRRENAALQVGAIELLDGAGKANQLLAYMRKCDQEMVLVLINFCESECTFTNKTQCEQELFQIGKYKRSEEGHIVLHPLSGLVLST